MANETKISKNRDGWTGDPCLYCDGTGKEKKDQRHLGEDCPACGGTGNEYIAELDMRERDDVTACLALDPEDPHDQKLRERLANPPFGDALDNYRRI